MTTKRLIKELIIERVRTDLKAEVSGETGIII